MIRVVAEYGQTMHGSIPLAHAQVETAARTGCWGYKTQLLTPDLIAQASADRYWAHGGAGGQRSSFERAGIIDYRAWEEVAAHCAAVGLVFVATPFDLDAVDAINTIDAMTDGEVWIKVASGDLTNVPLLRACADTGLRLIVSTGAATHEEIQFARGVLRKASSRHFDTERGPVWATPSVMWLACSLVYPTPIEDANLARLASLRRCVDSDFVGYSDHVGNSGTALAAAALGAQLLEVHCTLTPGPDTGCPDDAFALDEAHLDHYVRAANLGHAMLGDGALTPTDAEQPARAGASRTICARHRLTLGQILTADDLIPLRPAGDGIPVREWDHVVGQTVTADVEAGDPLHLWDVAGMTDTYDLLAAHHRRITP